MEPFASLCTLPRFDVPRLLINRELVGPFKHGRKRITDVALTGDLVDTVTEVAAQAGWVAELQHLTVSGNPGETEKDSTFVSDNLGQFDTMFLQEFFKRAGDLLQCLIRAHLCLGPALTRAKK